MIYVAAGFCALSKEIIFVGCVIEDVSDNLAQQQKITQFMWLFTNTILNCEKS